MLWPLFYKCSTLDILLNCGCGSRVESFHLVFSPHVLSDESLPVRVMCDCKFRTLNHKDVVIGCS